MLRYKACIKPPLISLYPCLIISVDHVPPNEKAPSLRKGLSADMLQFYYIDSLGAFRSALSVKAYRIAFGKGFKPVALD